MNVIDLLPDHPTVPQRFVVEQWRFTVEQWSHTYQAMTASSGRVQLRRRADLRKADPAVSDP
jgi:hypothetical protein